MPDNSTTTSYVGSSSTTAFIANCKCGRMATYHLLTKDLCDDCYQEYRTEEEYDQFKAFLKRAKKEGLLRAR